MNREVGLTDMLMTIGSGPWRCMLLAIILGALKPCGATAPAARLQTEFERLSRILKPTDGRAADGDAGRPSDACSLLAARLAQHFLQRSRTASLTAFSTVS